MRSVWLVGSMVCRARVALAVLQRFMDLRTAWAELGFKEEDGDVTGWR
jgi:hypothetical protein